MTAPNVIQGNFATPWGWLTCTVGDAGLLRVSFARETEAPLRGPWEEALAGYLAGLPIPTALPIDLAGVPPFTRRVLAACRQIPYGATVSYTQLAAAIGAPRAARAVGQALARNPAPLAIPCHRVLGAAGQLTGFLGGLPWKRALLDHERQGLALTNNENG